MCGIAGLINFNGEPVSSMAIKRMTDSLSHRGPNGEGQWVEDSVGIGHRRLSIIDLSHESNQPMASVDGRFILTYNGEIYNFRELRKELLSEGISSKSSGDSEVVLNSFIAWGENAFKKFNGMFALAIWDRKLKKLTVARDRYGIKPFYYSLNDNQFAFGSEQKAILSLSSFSRKLNKSALLEYFTFQNIFTNNTLIEDIFLFPPGSYGTLDLRKPTSNGSYELKLKTYWDYYFRAQDKSIDRVEYLSELDRLFQQAVKRQLISDVELGAYLSGGMDSGSITAVASSQFKDLKSFTCGFDLSSASGIELAFDEREKAEAMSAIFKTEHYEMVLKAGDMERCLEKLSWHLEEPRVGQSYPNYYAAKLASKFVKVVLSGTGGDEMFGGYPWRYFTAQNTQSFEDFVDNYYLYWQRLIDNKQIKKIFAPVWNEVKDVSTKDLFRDVFKNHDNALENPESYVNHCLYFECKTFLQGLFLVEDKLSMAHGLENRVPFMDNDLVDFAMSCPINFKLNNIGNTFRINENNPTNKKKDYFLKTSDGKKILRDVMKNYIPEEITKEKKQGFSSPDASWFKGESINFVRKTLFNDNASIYQVLDPKPVREIINEHLNGVSNRRLFIWSLLNVEAWMKNFINYKS